MERDISPTPKTRRGENFLYHQCSIDLVKQIHSKMEFFYWVHFFLLTYYQLPFISTQNAGSLDRWILLELIFLFLFSLFVSAVILFLFICFDYLFYFAMALAISLWLMCSWSQYIYTYIFLKNLIYSKNTLVGNRFSTKSNMNSGTGEAWSKLYKHIYKP